MELQSFNSHPNSGNSSPTYRELLYNDHHRSFFDEPPPSNGPRIKLMIRYGGRIKPRLNGHHHYSYFGGDTKILIVDRNVKFSNLIAKLCSMTFSEVCLKYQLLGEDLDTLISVYNDEDLDNMIFEFDRLCRVCKTPRLKVFLFPINHKNNASSDSESESFRSAINFAVGEDSKSNEQWFIDILNSARSPPSPPPVEDSPPPPPPTLEDSPPLPPPPSTAMTNPDYLFGLDKTPSASPAANQAELPVTVPDSAAKDTECETEAVTEREIQEVQIMHAVNDEQKVKIDGENGGVNGDDEQQVKKIDGENGCDEQKVKVDGENDGINGGVEDYSEENAEKVITLVTDEAAQDPVQVHTGSFHSCSVQVPEPVSVQLSYTQETYNVVAGGGYSMRYTTEPPPALPVYLVQTPSGLYQAVRPITGPTGQPVYFAYSPIVNNGGGYSPGSYVPNRSALPL